MSRMKVDMKGVGAGSASIGKAKAPQEERDLIKRRMTIRDNVAKWIKARKNYDLVEKAKTETKAGFVAYCDDKNNAYNPALQAIGKHFGINVYGSNRLTLCGNLYETLKNKEARAIVRGITADRFSTINILPSIATTKKAPGREKGTRKLRAGLEHTETTEENFKDFAKRARSMSREEFIADCQERAAKRLPFIKEAIKYVSGGELGGFAAQYGPGGPGSQFKLYCGLFHDRVHGRETKGAKSLEELKAKAEKRKEAPKAPRQESKGDTKRSAQEDVTPTPRRYEEESDEDIPLELSEDIYEEESEEETPLELSEDIYEEETPRKGAGAGAGSRQSRFRVILDED